MTPRLLDELKRRRVHRVSLAYCAAALVVGTSAFMMVPALRLPAGTMTLLVGLLAVGAVVAVALSWVVDLTPDGVVVTPPRGAPERPGRPVQLSRRAVLASGVVVVAAVVTSAAMLLHPTANAVHGGPAAPASSLTVLPFADVGAGGDSRFADRLGTEILRALARAPELRVAPRNGSREFRDGADVRSIAGSMDAHVLQGTVRRDGERVRITAQLVRSADNAPVWSQVFERSAYEAPRAHEEIASEIARSLRATLKRK